MRKILLALSICCGLFAQAQESPIAIVPEPVSIVMPATAGRYLVSPASKIGLAGKGLENSADFFNEYLQKSFGYKLDVKSPGKKTDIILTLSRTSNPVSGAYTLSVDTKGITISGHDELGVFYGIQTLLQLIPTAETNHTLPTPFVNISDYPRFAYRGLMLDVGRHFFDVNFVKKYIDFLALHKMNYFHWHLTDDQGWRIEIKKYPKLTEKGAWRNGTIIGNYPGKGNDNTRSGGFYTQEEIKDIVKYAEKRYITIIPEIEMPGHASAAIAAYPELSCFPDEATKTYYFNPNSAWAGDSTGKQVQQIWGVCRDVFVPSENTFKFLEGVLDEVIALFPSKYIHVGGDECPKDNWKRSEFCQQLMKEKGLKDEHALQSYFIQRMEKYINSKGRSIIGWDEILEGGLAPNATVMSWRGEDGGIEAANSGHNVVMTPNTYVYFDYAQSKKEDSVVIGGYLPLDKVYNYEPLPTALPADKQKFILGAQANVWTEYMDNPSKVEYMIFPRMSALSEVLWSQKEKRSFANFQQKLPLQIKRYLLWGINYSKAFYEPQADGASVK
ncbi:beta-N-acetylhexosaminidase [Flavihumibacter profundi]|uniref:beta-N-acetylhexosaminidase n=1 Tax=Flavihumibacter profundi TaxID=2716883 RepID=UPI001CC54E7F|nr:beta-N-acetylhexosaminidase [Flavihumibacter profundi]MBZ5856384.1 beta-N-acetylhexosaminidase [Flavihumibacter profundi]